MLFCRPFVYLPGNVSEQSEGGRGVWTYVHTYRQIFAQETASLWGVTNFFCYSTKGGGMVTYG